jgi:hypothetical protein
MKVEKEPFSRSELSASGVGLPRKLQVMCQFLLCQLLHVKTQRSGDSDAKGNWPTDMRTACRAESRYVTPRQIVCWLNYTPQSETICSGRAGT